MKLQKLGGYAAVVNFCSMLVLIAFYILRIKRFGNMDNPVDAIAAISSAPADFYFFYLLIMFGGIIGMITLLALDEQMKKQAPNLCRLAIIAASVSTAATIFTIVAKAYAIENIVPTNDVSAYRALDGMAQSMWNASGHTFGWVGLLLGYAVLKTRMFPKTPAWLYIVVGVFWVRIPVPVELGVLAIIPWIAGAVASLWFGICLLRMPEPNIE